mgnify:CR=1 FL=1|jgi:hypothetical protein
MAHYAELDALQRVVRILVVDDINTQDKNGGEVESVGARYLNRAFGGTWLQTSYNSVGSEHREPGTPFRKNYAGIGYTYDQSRDAFIPPKPYPSWVLNEDNCLWDAPTPMPDDDQRYMWNEETQAWTLQD